MYSPENLYGVFGAGGCGRGIMPLARRLIERHGIPQDRLVFVVDNPGAGHLGDTTNRRVNGHSLVSWTEFVEDPTARNRYVALAVADGRLRANLYTRCMDAGVASWTIIADNVERFDDVEIGEGALISPYVTLTSNIRIGRCFHGNLYSYVEHDCVIGDFVTFAPGAKCNGNIRIDDFAYIGSGATIKQGISKPLVIGKGAIVGMGAVVTRDVAPFTTVVGVPADIHGKK